MPKPMLSSELKPGQPAWRVALFFPEQGGWTEEDYLALDGGPLVDYEQGCVEVHDMPTKEHQRIVQYLFLVLHRFIVAKQAGEVFVAPLPVRLWPQKYREPDLVFLSSDHPETDGYPDGADLVVEVVSPGAENRRRDGEVKPTEYARAKIAEYWLVDPGQQTVTIHILEQSQYKTHTLGRSEELASHRLPGLIIPVADILGAASR